MKVLVACEFSGMVREAFRAKGHDAWSCDLLPTEIPSDKHYVNDVMDVVQEGWDLIIAHPPYTHLAVSGARWFKNKKEEQKEAISFFLQFTNYGKCCNIPKVCIENPIGIMSRYYKKPSQIIQPWQFGHGETKATCLWLKNLPKLQPTNIVEGREQRIHKMPPSPDRRKERSRTYQGIANAMAEQWG